MKSNEEDSAKLVRFIGKYFDLPEAFIRRVSTAILATKHTAIPEDLESRTLCDLDLAILGYPQAAFDKYEEQIGKEYDWVVPKDRFRAERIAILESFLKRPRIYSMNFFHEKYGAQARKNLERSIARLSKQ